MEVGDCRSRLISIQFMTSRSKKNRQSKRGVSKRGSAERGSSEPAGESLTANIDSHDSVEKSGAHAGSVEANESNTPNSSRPNSSRLSKTSRRVISLFIVAYLGIVVLGPLSNPIGSEFLTRRLAKMVSPLHQSLYLGHGYRFFGPDPGPSHLVVYRIIDQDGNVSEGHFPDREKHSPRLIYHRWFMLSETVFNEHAMTPDSKSFRESDAELDAQVKLLRRSGKFAMSQHIASERRAIAQRYEDTLKRIDGLVNAIASHLLKANDGQRIELFVQERSIPFAGQVLTGVGLDDPQFLSPLTKIGEFVMGADGEAHSLEQASLGESAREKRSLESVAPAKGGSRE